MEPPPLSPPAAPTPPEQRAEYLDALRGIALLGILLVNMHGHKSSFVASSPLATYIPGEWNLVTVHLVDVFASGKFISIFSFLFGFGLALQAGRWSTDGSRRQSFSGFILRRMVVLGVLGVLHGILLWAGDVLTLYALMGITTIVMHRRRVRTLLVLAALSLAVYTLTGISPYMRVSHGAWNTEWRTAADAWVACYQKGGISWIIASRFTEWLYTLPWLFPQQGFHSYAFFLLGMAAGKSGTAAFLEFVRARAQRWLKPLLATGMLTAALFPVYCTGVLESVPGSWLALLVSEAGGNTLLALCYIIGGVLLFSSGRCPQLTALLAGAGRLSLTNYLMQSVLANAIFMSWGLALYGRTNAQTGVLISLMIFALQLVLSRLWLRHHRTGPMEMLWRKISYPRGNTAGGGV